MRTALGFFRESGLQWSMQLWSEPERGTKTLVECRWGAQLTRPLARTAVLSALPDRDTPLEIVEARRCGER